MGLVSHRGFWWCGSAVLAAAGEHGDLWSCMYRAIRKSQHNIQQHDVKMC